VRTLNHAVTDLGRTPDRNADSPTFGEFLAWDESFIPDLISSGI
jgi:hypothetical protein